MKRISVLIAASLLATSAIAADNVATISSQEGTVLVNQGEEFVTAADAQALKAGDRVMVMEGGSAQITFTDGCVLPLEAGSLVSVPAVSTCVDAKVAKVERIGPSYAQAVGATGEKSRTAEYLIFGGAGVLIVGALVNDDYSIEPDPPVPPISP